ncbi:MAG: MFS transporter [Prevotella sp.]|jgi:FHS family L-fucose permease-like MFS transporter|nr:MFS transporter [Prevotella sp.]MCI1282485.1 MFS transporter [Prevotella sp.]
MKKSSWIYSLLPVLFAFFVMGFVDFVGIAMNYVKQDFHLSDTIGSLIPMMVFVWFLFLSIPAGMMAGKIGYKRTVLLGLAITVVAMALPILSYQFGMLLVAFALLGIGNTLLQVCLNPLVGCLVDSGKMASFLTLGQFIKAISSFLGPILVSLMVSWFFDWRIVFYVYAFITLISALWFAFSVQNSKDSNVSVVTFSSLKSVLKDSYILSAFIGILLVCGIDIGLNTGIPQLLMTKLGWPLATAGLGTSVYFAARTIGTFLGTFILLKVSSLKFLRYTMIVALFAFLLLLFSNGKEMLFAMIVVIGLMCSNVFSIIFSLALNHNRGKMNEISSFMIMGICGGALVIPLMGFLSDRIGIALAMGILVLCVVYLLIWSFMQYSSLKSDSSDAINSK